MVDVLDGLLEFLEDDGALDDLLYFFDVGDCGGEGDDFLLLPLDILDSLDDEGDLDDFLNHVLDILFDPDELGHESLDLDDLGDLDDLLD